MRFTKLVPLLIIGLMVLVGCEGSKYPLSNPMDSVADESIVGSWQFQGDDSDDMSFLNIFAFDDNAYYVETWEEGDEDELIRLNVFSTEIDGVLFANMRCINCDDDDEDKPYLFVRYELIADDQLRVELIADDVYNDIEELESIDAVNYFVRKRMHDNDFYEEEAGIYRRMSHEAIPGR